MGRLALVAGLGSVVAGCGLTIPETPVGTPPTVEVTVEADGGERVASMGPGSCSLEFFDYERPVLVIASGRDADEAVKLVRLEGSVDFFCGAGDAIDALSQPVLEEFVDDASPGEQGRKRRSVLRLIQFEELDAMCVAEAPQGGFLDYRNVNLHVSARVENFHGGAAETPTIDCVLDYGGPPPSGPSS